MQQLTFLARIFTAIISVCMTVPNNGRYAQCEAGKTNVSLDVTRQGYYELHQFVLAHPIIHGKIPPKVLPFASAERAANDSISNDSSDKPINIMQTFLPVDILSLDATEQVLSMTGYMSLIWTDPQLRWDIEDYNNVGSVQLTASDIWIPALSVLNMVGKKEILQDYFDSPVDVYSDGNIIFSISVHLQTTCKTDLMYFPFDTQKCDIIFYHTSRTQVAISAVDLGMDELLKSYTAGGEWTLTSMKWKNIKDVYEKYSNSRHIKYTLTLKRMTTFYTITILGPMVLFTLMNCLVFIIPPESGEKISFLISIFISNAIFSSYINGVMPRGLGTHVPLLMVYLTWMWVMSLLVFLATVVVLRKYHAEQQVQPTGDVNLENQPQNSSCCQKLQPLLKSMTKKWRKNQLTISAITPSDQSCSDAHISTPEPTTHKAGEIELSEGHNITSTANKNKPFLVFDSECSSQKSMKCGREKSSLTSKKLDRNFFMLSLSVVALSTVGVSIIMMKGQ